MMRRYSLTCTAVAASVVRFEAFDDDTGKARHVVSNDEYMTRNSTPGGFFAFAWDGQTFTGKGKNANQIYTMANGRYILRLRAEGARR